MRVGVGVAVRAGVGVGVAGRGVGVAVGDGRGVGARVRVGDGDAVGVADGVGVAVTDGIGRSVNDGLAIAVAEGDGGAPAAPPMVGTNARTPPAAMSAPMAITRTIAMVLPTQVVGRRAAGAGIRSSGSVRSSLLSLIARMLPRPSADAGAAPGGFP